MALKHMITTVEMHTAGEPFRIVGRRAWLQARVDYATWVVERRDPLRRGFLVR